LTSSDTLRRWLPMLGASIPLIILPITALSVPLSAAKELGLSPQQTSNWLLAWYGLPGILALVLSIRTRQPLVVTGNFFVLVFIASLGGQVAYPELIAATIVAGFGVVVASLLGITGKLSAWVPAPIVLGLLAGAILPFVADVFTSLGEAPAMIGGTLIAYLVSRRLLKDHVPPVLPAMIVGLALAAATGQIGAMTTPFSLPVPMITTPVFSLNAILTAAPVLFVLITLQATVPALIFLESQGYHPPEKLINVICGMGTALGSLLGPTGVSISLPGTSLAAGAHAGEPGLRYRTMFAGGGMAVLIAVFARIAAELPEVIPLPLLLTLAGLSLIDVLTRALGEISKGPLVIGPVFAFVIAVSQISLFGFGPYFWALVIGVGSSLLLEREAIASLRGAEVPVLPD